MRSKSGKDIVHVGQCEIEVGPCPSCLGTATKGEALHAIAEWIGTHFGRTQCGSCGKPIALENVVLSHSHESSSADPSWRVAAVSFQPSLFFSEFQLKILGLHRSCAVDVLPFAELGPLSEKPEVVRRMKELFPEADLPGSSLKGS